MQEKTTNLTASMQGTLYEANFKNRHPCAEHSASHSRVETRLRNIPQVNSRVETCLRNTPQVNSRVETRLRNTPQVNSQVETHLRNIPQVNSEWKHICGTFRKQV